VRTGDSCSRNGNNKSLDSPQSRNAPMFRFTLRTFKYANSPTIASGVSVVATSRSSVIAIDKHIPVCLWLQIGGNISPRQQDLTQFPAIEIEAWRRSSRDGESIAFADDGHARQCIRGSPLGGRKNHRQVFDPLGLHFSHEKAQIIGHG